MRLGGGADPARALYAALKIRNAPFSPEMVLNYISVQALKLPRAY
jgi:hypothetical protein